MLLLFYRCQQCGKRNINSLLVTQMFNYYSSSIYSTPHAAFQVVIQPVIYLFHGVLQWASAMPSSRYLIHFDILLLLLLLLNSFITKVEDETCFLSDCGSSNKTRFGRVQLRPNIKYGLRDGDEITFGDVKCVFHEVSCSTSKFHLPSSLFTLSSFRWLSPHDALFTLANVLCLRDTAVLNAER